jgi:hypothetical protein
MASHPDFVRIVLQHPQSLHANELAVKLLTGAENRRLNRADEPSLDPFRVAQVLAWLANTEPQNMNWVVRQGLSWLGIDRITRLGRPPGRVKDKEYLNYFNGAMLLIEQEQLWEAKQDSQRKHPSNWRLEPQCKLQKQAWGPETVEFLVTARSKRAFAIKFVSRHFNTELDWSPPRIPVGRANGGLSIPSPCGTAVWSSCLITTSPVRPMRGGC